MDLVKIEMSLVNIGFTDKEAQIYLYLLKNGKSQVGKINMYVDIPRTTIYQLLDKLVEKGFIVKEKIENIFFYEAISPNEIDLFLKEEENKIKYKQNTFNSIFPYLETLKNLSQNNKKFDSIYFEGVSGCIKIMDEFIKNAKEEILRICTTGENKDKKLLEYERDIFRKKRINKKLPIKLILNEAQDVGEIVSLDKNDLRKTKIISQENGKVENLIISGNHILIFKGVGDIHGTYLCDESIAGMFKIMFSYIWEK